MNAALEPVHASWRILFLTCRDPATDFRLPLAQELQALGHDVTYVYLKRRPTVTDIKTSSRTRTLSLFGFLRYAIREFRAEPNLLVFNSSNLVFPGLCRILRLLCGGFWCFDMHDDLLYGSSGWARQKAIIAQWSLLRGSDLVVNAAPTLAELFPGSHHLGNASSIRPIERAKPNFDRILVLASLDDRLDYDCLTKAANANADLTFEIHGRISQDDPATVARLRALTYDYSNIVYRGPYTNADLPGILADHSVMFAPYVVDTRITRYLDPLRYYHCLNSGMELISTTIPRAKDFGDLLHVVQSPDEIGPLIVKLRDNPEYRRNANPYNHIQDWQQRAKQLIDIVDRAARVPIAALPTRMHADIGSASEKHR